MCQAEGGLQPEAKGGGGDGSTFQDLEGPCVESEAWYGDDTRLPSGWQDLSFSAGFTVVNLEHQFVLEVVQQGKAFPFVSLPPPSRVPVKIPLPCLRLKREALWEEIASLLTKEAVKTVQLSQDRGWGWGGVGRGGCIPIASWLPSILVGSTPFSTSLGSTRITLSPSSIWRPSTLLFRIFTTVDGWCCWT